MTNKKLLLNTRELAELTGFSEGTLRHWVSQKRLPVVRLSARCVRFRLDDVQEWLASKVDGPGKSISAESNRIREQK
jgi:excisionase family DNA binding protein